MTIFTAEKRSHRSLLFSYSWKCFERWYAFRNRYKYDKMEQNRRQEGDDGLENQYLSVTQLTRYIKQKFDRDPYLERVYLTGEISNFNRNRRNSHQYFSLKDDGAKISAVMFRSAFQRVRFTPEEGMKVLVIGRISVYEKTGAYQMYVEHMEPDGIGQLYQAFEETKKKLEAEGIFSRPKKGLPRFPKRIAVITSPSGAVIRDIITTVKRRYPIVQLVLYPTYVQGERAADSIVKNIKAAEENGTFDALIVARGGGSFEDLWPFNEERVARTIAGASIPVISSVGHETDTTLSDLAADVRAATPTAAAELAVPVLQDEMLKIEQMHVRMMRAYQKQLGYLNERWKRSASSYIFRQPQRLYEGYAQSVDYLMERLGRGLKEQVDQHKQQLSVLEWQLEAQQPGKLIEQRAKETDEYTRQLYVQMNRYMENQKNQTAHLIQSLDFLSPLKILGRGYSYVTKEATVIKSTEQLSPGDMLHIHFQEGTVDAEVKNIVEPGENEGEKEWTKT